MLGCTTIVSRRTIIILFLLFALSVEFRLYYAFQTPHYSSSSAYGTLRNIQSIHETGKPILEDPFVHREAQIFPPSLFEYILAGFSFIFPLHFISKILPAIFISTLVFIIYVLAYHVSHSESAALFSSILATFSPILYKTIASNSISTYTLAIPLMFLLLYCFMRVEEPRFLYLYLLCMILLPLIHSIAIILLLVLLVYLILMKVDRLEISRQQKEIVLFTFLYTTWVTFLFYKNALLLYGPSILWQNIPASILDEFFAQTTIVGSLLPIGLLPFLLGLYVIYKTMFVEKEPSLNLLFALAISISFLLWLKLIKLELGLLIISLLLCILFAKAYTMFLSYVEKTHFWNHYPVFVIVFFFIFLLTSVYPSLSYARNNLEETVSARAILAYSWMKEYTPEDAVVLVPFEEGHYVTAISQRRVLADSNYLLLKDVDVLAQDIRRMYTTQYETEAVRLFDKYNIDLIFLSERTKKEYGISGLAYANNENCFKKLLTEGGDLYSIRCRLEEN